MSMPGSVPKAKPGYASIGIPFDGMTLGTLRWFLRACGNAGNADFPADDISEVGAVNRQKFQQAGANRTKSGDTEGEGFHGGGYWLADFWGRDTG